MVLGYEWYERVWLAPLLLRRYIFAEVLLRAQLMRRR